MKRLEQLLLSSQLEKEELKQINGGAKPLGRPCECKCRYGVGTWIEYSTSSLGCPAGGSSPSTCLDSVYDCHPIQ